MTEIKGRLMVDEAKEFVIKRNTLSHRRVMSGSEHELGQLISSFNASSRVNLESDSDSCRVDAAEMERDERMIHPFKTDNI